MTSDTEFTGAGSNTSQAGRHVQHSLGQTQLRHAPKPSMNGIIHVPALYSNPAIDGHGVM